MKEEVILGLNSNFQPNRTNGEQISAKTVFTCQILTNLTRTFFYGNKTGNIGLIWKRNSFSTYAPNFVPIGQTVKSSQPKNEISLPSRTITLDNKFFFFFLILPRPNQLLQISCMNGPLCITNCLSSRFEGKYPQATQLWTKKIFFRHVGAEFPQTSSTLPNCFWSVSNWFPMLYSAQTLTLVSYFTWKFFLRLVRA
jgi:hypothetical protein